MKRIISITLCTLLYHIGIASNLEIDGIYYLLDENTQTATVTYKGNADDWMFDATGETLYTGNVIIPEKVTYNTKEYTVTTLGDDAFAGCKQLHSLSLPKNISSIGNGTFTQCYGLQVISVANENTTYFSEGGILYSFSPRAIVLTPRALSGKVTVNKEMTEITIDAFNSCKQITEIVIPNGVTAIRDGAFYKCNALWRITMGNEVASIGDWAFYNCNNLAFLTIPDATKSIGFNAFSGCQNLMAIKMNDELQTIGKAAFNNCNSLREITLPTSLTFIDDNAFRSCSSLTSIINLSNLVLTEGGSDNGGVAYYAGIISTEKPQPTQKLEHPDLTPKTAKLDSIQASPLFNLENLSVPDNGTGSQLTNYYIEYMGDTTCLTSLTQEYNQYILQKSWYKNNTLIRQTNRSRSWSNTYPYTLDGKWFLEDSTEYTYNENGLLANTKFFAEDYTGTIGLFYEQKKLYTPETISTQIRYSEDEEWLREELKTSTIDAEGNGQTIDSLWVHFEEGDSALYGIVQKTFEQGNITIKDSLSYDVDFGTLTSGMRETYFYNEENLVCATFRYSCDENSQWTLTEKEFTSYDLNDNRLGVLSDIEFDTKHKTEFKKEEDTQFITTYYWDNWNEEWKTFTTETFQTVNGQETIGTVKGRELFLKINSHITASSNAPETLIYTKNSNTEIQTFYYSPIEDDDIIDDEETTAISTIKQNEIWFYEGKLYSKNYPIYSIEVYNLIGEKCKQITPQTLPIDLNIPNGNYILKVNNAIVLRITNIK